MIGVCPPMWTVGEMCGHVHLYHRSLLLLLLMIFNIMESMCLFSSSCIIFDWVVEEIGDDLRNIDACMLGE